MAVLIILFTVVPLLELAILIHIGGRIGFWGTVGLVLVPGVLGALLARWQGLRALRRVQEELAQGRMPARQILDGLLILAAGVLLITPGLITDCVGLLLLLPPVRWMAGLFFRRWVTRRFLVVPPGSPFERPFNDLKDADAVVRDPKPAPPERPPGP